LRITGGTAKNRKLISPKSGWKNDVRPTSDRVREALFSILGEKVAGARVLDLFAGTGSLGLEALSRGAASAVFVDQSYASLDLIRQNLNKCFTDVQADYLRLDLAKIKSFSLLRQHIQDDGRFTLIFLDPPYEKKLAEMALTMVEKTGLVVPAGIVVAEERWKVELPERVGSLYLHLHRRYGETGIWLYIAEKTST